MENYEFNIKDIKQPVIGNITDSKKQIKNLYNPVNDDDPDILMSYLLTVHPVYFSVDDYEKFKSNYERINAGYLVFPTITMNRDLMSPPVSYLDWAGQREEAYSMGSYNVTKDTKGNPIVLLECRVCLPSAATSLVAREEFSVNLNTFHKIGQNFINLLKNLPKKNDPSITVGFEYEMSTQYTPTLLNSKNNEDIYDIENIKRINSLSKKFTNTTNHVKWDFGTKGVTQEFVSKPIHLYDYNNNNVIGDKEFNNFICHIAKFWKTETRTENIEKYQQGSGSGGRNIIINPITNETYLLNSYNGKQLLKQYIKYYKNIEKI